MLPHVLTQTPGLPTASDLAGLHPAVSVALIVAGLALAFKDSLRDRLRRKPVDPAPTEKPASVPATVTAKPAEATTAQLPTLGTPALDRAEARATETIERLEGDVAYFRQQLADRDQWWQRQLAQMQDSYERRIDQLERRVRDVEAENQRLWRGPTR